MSRTKIIKSVTNLLMSGPDPKSVMKIMTLLGSTSTGYTALPLICDKIYGSLKTEDYQAFFFCMEVIVNHI